MKQSLNHWLVGAGLGFFIGTAAAESAVTEVVEVIGVTPVGAGGLEIDLVPADVQTGTAADIEASNSLDLTDFLNRSFGSVTINAAQNNPLQPDVQYRGFTASPLLGLPQGLSIYQNGVRVNEVLGDAVNWELIPQNAISDITLVGGSNPLFGLNTLGGALSIKMKNGFTAPGSRANVSFGSFDRKQFQADIGGSRGNMGWFAALSGFEEDGWRDLSPSDAWSFYGSMAVEQDNGQLEFSYQYGESFLTGNGAAPEELLDMDRSAIFTAPDETENRLHQFTLNGEFDVDDRTQLAGTAFYRMLKTNSFNGDASEFEECDVAGLGEILLEGDEDEIDMLACDGSETRAAIEAGGEIEVVEDVDGNPIDAEFTDSNGNDFERNAINNISIRDQEAYGGDLQAKFDGTLGGKDNQLIVGIGLFRGEVDFDADTEVSYLDPVLRTTKTSEDTGVFVEEARTRVNATTDTYSIYALDNVAVTDDTSVSFGGRYDHTRIKIRDRSGDHPELNGDHMFNSFNPMVGMTWARNDNSTVFASLSQSSRAPTPIELSCNETIAETHEALTGDDDFECRLPNAFLADPPLEQVVTRTAEIGTRGRHGKYGYHLGAFWAVNNDDIIFQSTGRATGLFKNVDKTQRIGIETRLTGENAGVQWYAAYSFIHATFESSFNALSPNHPNANADGQISVGKGDRIPGIPEHQFKFGADIRVPGIPGLRIGPEIIANSSQVLRGDESNQMDEVDGYFIVNLNASYEVSKGVEIYAKVDNLLDTEYETFGIIGEEPDEVIPTLGDNPVFLGAGPKIGGWLGIKLTL